MPSPRVRLAPVDEVATSLAALRTELHIPAAFPDAVLAEADERARLGPLAVGGAPRPDRTDVDLVTIDPEGSTDLDQAYGAQRTPQGYRVSYAIADLGAWVAPGGAIDAEARARGVTVYAPDGRAPLHPTVLSEGAASLLPDGDRPALLWTLELDRDGALTGTRVERATVRSRAKLSYAGVQRDLDAGTAADTLVLLREIGRLRVAQEAARGGVSLDLPEQEVEREDGGYRLAYRPTLPVERWNAQISLLTGMAAAQLMLASGHGLLRTLPPPDAHTVAVLRAAAHALHISWPDTTGYAARMRDVDTTTPAGAALVHQAARLFRGAGYLVLDGGPLPPPDRLVHAAIAAPYAHVTAPLRRLGDRFANELVLAAVAGGAPPEWVEAGLAEVPAQLGAGQSRQSSLDRAVLDLVEALVLRHHTGETFRAVVVDADERGATVQLDDPAVIARLGPRDAHPLPVIGASVALRLVAADPVARRVEFAVDPTAAP